MSPYLFGADEGEALAKQWVVESIPGSGKVAGVSLDSLKQRAVDYAFQEGRQFLQQLQQNVTYQKVVGATEQTYALGKDTADLIGFWQKDITNGKFRADVGVAFAGQLGVKAFQLGTAIAKLAGGDEETVNAINEWAAVGGGCVTAIAAGAAAGGYGAIGGAAVCLATILAKVFTSLSGPKVIDLPAYQPRAYFRPATKEQLPWIQQDAGRLAAVLVAHYKATALQPIIERLNRWPYYGDYSQAWLAKEGVTVQKPAIDSWALLQAFNFEAAPYADDPTSGYSEIRHALYTVATKMSAWEDSHRPAPGVPLGWGASSVFDLLRHYISFNDTTASAIKCGATLGRALIAAGGDGRATIVVPSAFDNPNANHAWRANGMKPELSSVYPVTTTANFRPFVHVASLINFFMAATYRDLQGPNRNALLSSLQGVSPIVSSGVVDSNFPGGYASRCWTDLYRGSCVTGQTCTGSMTESHSLASCLAAGDETAIQEFAMLRLQCALTYMIIAYKTTSLDLITNVAQSMAVMDPALRLLHSPVDPRQLYIGGGLLPVELAQQHSPGDLAMDIALPPTLVGKYATTAPVGLEAIRDMGSILADIAAREAEIGAAVLAGRKKAIDELQGTMHAAITWPPTSIVGGMDSLRAAFASGQLVSVSDLRARCESAGGALTSYADGNLNRFVCEPTPAVRAALEQQCVSTGGVPVWTDKGLACRGQGTVEYAVAQGGGIGSLVVLAGAAFLALKLFGR